MRHAIQKTMALIDRLFRFLCRIFPRAFREGFIVRYHRLWTYGFFGCINTAIDYIVYALLYYLLRLPISAAQFAGLLCGSINGYLLNSSITFEEGRGRSKGQFFQYIGVDLVLAFVSGAFMQWAEAHLTLPMILLKLILTAVITVIHYITYKKLVFRIRKGEGHV